MSEEHADVLVPHSKRDLVRVSLVIMGTSVPLFVIAWRFFFLGASDQESHAGLTFVVGATLLLVVGAIIGVKTLRRN